MVIEKKSEIKRKIVHMSVALFSFLLRYLSLPAALICATIAFIHNAFILPRIGGRKIYRKEEIQKGYPLGILLYPITVFILILIYRNHFYIAAAIWAIMGFGDGSAALIGSIYGKHKLPWNREKSYEGSLSYIIFGSAGACLLCWWTSLGKGAPLYPDYYNFIIVPIVVTVFSALLESYPTKLDDNFTIPIIGSFLMYSLYHLSIPLDYSIFKSNILPALIISIIFGSVALILKTVDIWGYVAGVIVGIINYSFIGLEGFLILAAFFILGSVATKLGYKEKKQKGLAEKKGGARSWTNAISKCSVGSIIAIIASFSLPEYKLFFLTAFVASYAAATADTLSSEIGQWKGKIAYSLISFKKVPPGTEGAISLQGSLAGIIGAIIIGLMAYYINLINLFGILIITIAAIISNIFESYMGIFFESKGLADKESINFLNTLSAAVIAYVISIYIY
jgi:uncharacterized protein (TIGR00297 family)